MIADDFNKKEETLASNCWVGYTIDKQVILNTPTHISISGVGSITFDEIKQLVTAKQNLKNMLDIQGHAENWSVNEYMRGLYNGLVLAGISVGLTKDTDLKIESVKECQTQD